MNGDSFELLKEQQDNSFDSVITDPPYGLSFMNKDWDLPDNIAFKEEFWKEVLRVLKPGGHLLAFSGSRTYHWMAVAIEKAGFEIRDQIMWLYGSGFPKSQSVDKLIEKKEKREGIQDTGNAEKWVGWGTTLKPAHEPIVMARKPFEGSTTQNILDNGVGALNIDESRVPFKGDDQTSIAGKVHIRGENVSTSLGAKQTGTTQNDNGRFPTNVIHDGSDEVIDSFPHTKKGGSITKADTYDVNNQVYGKGWGKTALHESYGDSGSAARFFYGSKSSTTDRNEGLELKENDHPTVKPTDLMVYLVRLITPQGGKILDPFNGSGSTGKAVAYLNRSENKDYSYLGIELQEKFTEISRKRIEYTLENKIWMETKK